MPVPSQRGPDQRGSGTVVIMAMVAVVMTVTIALAACMGAFAAHRQAQAVADLSALSGAIALSRGDDACRIATEIAAAMGAHVSVCAPVDGILTLTVDVPGPGWWWRSWHAEAQAQAGPG